MRSRSERLAPSVPRDLTEASGFPTDSPPTIWAKCINIESEPKKCRAGIEVSNADEYTRGAGSHLESDSNRPCNAEALKWRENLVIDGHPAAARRRDISLTLAM